MYIYIDVLIVTNIYAIFFLIKATARFTHNSVGNIRLLISSILGGLFSLVILLPELSVLLLFVIRVISAIIVNLICFYRRNFLKFYRTTLIYFFVSFILTGVEYLLGQIFSDQILWHNSVLYINVSLLNLIVATIATYLILTVLRKIFDSSNDFDESYTITVIHNNKTLTLNAVSDSCNNLIDSFTGRPVIICTKKMLYTLFPDDSLNSAVNITESCGSDGNLDYTKNLKGWRLIPYTTIDSNGILPSFLPNSIYIKDNQSGKLKLINAYIGVSDADIEYAIFNPKIIKS